MCGNTSIVREPTIRLDAGEDGDLKRQLTFVFSMQLGTYKPILVNQQKLAVMFYGEI